MMSLGENNLFLAIWKGHGDLPQSQMDPKPIFFFGIPNPKIGGGGPQPQPNPGRWGPRGGVPSTYAIYICISLGDVQEYANTERFQGWL